MKINTFYPTKPHAGQKKVLEELDSGTRFVQLRAGRKWRKTSLIISWLIEMALKTGLTCPYVAPSKVQAKNIVWDDHIPRLLTHFKEIGMPYKTNQVELSVEFPNGKIQLYGVENAESLRGISNWGAFAGDEYDDWADDIWTKIVRPNLITHRAPAIMAGTPKGFRNLYSLEHLDPDHTFKCFHFTSYDNPDIEREELDDLVKEYKDKGDDAFQQEIMAEYVKPTGIVYGEWGIDKQYISVDYDARLPLELAFDFGVNDPTAVIWIQKAGGEYRIIDYYEASNASIDHFVSVINGKPYKQITSAYGDPAGEARSIVTNTSPIDEYRRYGIHIRTKAGVTIPEQIRITHKYMPSLFVSDACDRVRDCILNYRYPEKKSTLINQSNELPIHDEFSHAMRALEYYFVNQDTGTPMESWKSKISQFDSKPAFDKWGLPTV